MHTTSWGDRLFDACNHLLLGLLMLATLYPFWYVMIASLGDPAWVAAHRGPLWWPSGPNVEAYKAVFANPVIRSGYVNTLFVAVVGTTLNVAMTALAAYGLSRPRLMLGNAITFYIVFTMFFSGGLVPFYLVVAGLGMIDSLWALIIPGAMSAFNFIIMRTSFQSIPVSMDESARLDGARDLTILIRVILPLSLPVVAVMVLFYGVAHWNSWFSAAIFLRSRELYPLQLVLREILINNNTESMMSGITANNKAVIGETIKYATIIVATGPVLLLYPFLQRYFVKGVMIGAIKE